MVLLSTARAGRPNVMTMSWHTMMDFEPPLVGCVISDRNYSFAALKATRECVINIPTASLAEKVVGCGNTTGARVDKFARFGLTPTPGRHVSAPLIKECYASLECRVKDTRMSREYGFFVLEVLEARVDSSVKQAQTLHHRGKGEFMIAGKVIQLPSRMK